MASGKNTGNRNSTKKSTTKKNIEHKKTRTKKQGNTDKNSEVNNLIKDEIKIWGTLAVCLLLMISHFDFGGVIGNTVSNILFGIFGILAYVIPIFIFVGVAFAITNRGNSTAYIKIIAAIVLGVVFCIISELIMNGYDSTAKILEYYKESYAHKTGGGILGGIFVNLLCVAIGEVGTYMVSFIVAIICAVLITEKSVLSSVKNGGAKAYTSAKADMQRRKEEKIKKVNDNKEYNAGEDKKLRLRRKDKVVSGITFNTTLDQDVNPNQKKSPEMREITANGKSDSLRLEELPLKPEDVLVTREEPSGQLVINRAQPFPESDTKDEVKDGMGKDMKKNGSTEETEQSKEVSSSKYKVKSTAESKKQVEMETQNVEQQIQKAEEKPKRVYKYPPVSLLKRGNLSAGDSDDMLRQTAAKLEETLQTFGVNVTVTNVSCGPTVTRYELQPELGVKVSKIVGLADDIKLNLAAADIRIEAPIPGKAAVGIEVPNKEKSAVMLRDLLESEEFKNHKSKIAFAAGRDISGQVIVTDIANMPHALIAGTTGSGKSVCINTLIMSILYKASPEEVRMILIDPKVVELGIYNKIPHLLIPVVTDPKKAAGALNWAVAEMTRRYQLFAEYNVRDLVGYNKKVESVQDIEAEEKPQKLPQIVIIVDELADLMMVAANDVEEAICRLAQLARAAGIHLIVATQRPSVDVITGLIKANMPTRIAFKVSSGVDSRTILDCNGAEKLLGKGDMLISFQDYAKPIRMQGAFVSDLEREAVVDFLANNSGSADFDENITNQVNTSALSNGGLQSGNDEKDVYFVDAGKFVIEKDKASIGMLQRVFKIGFNRAARIMDQLCEAGVVGEEEGTKPRKVLMSMEQFEQYIEEYL